MPELGDSSVENPRPESAKDMYERIEQAQIRTNWFDSQERRDWKRNVSRFAAVALVLGGLLGFYFPPSLPGSSEMPIISWRISGLFSGMALGGVAVVYFAYFNRRPHFRSAADRFMLGIDQIRLAQAEAKLAEVSDADDGSTDFASLWQVTQRRLDYYHRIATTQSERSFSYGQRAAWLGLALLTLCAVLSILAKSPTAAGIAGALGLAGGGLAGYLGRTFMRTQEAATAQLREYFAQPLEFSRYLAAERILESIADPEIRARATATLVEAIVDRHQPTREDHRSAPEAASEKK
ncbi:hypothetical protein [Streptomyces sp. SID13031]|uniref:hypothetical protein n=1 Tax=Streptomyces sp. SID13031 TaxID=2706046 RepID=UPI0013C7A522|nr:hypothetical protein [Streptomyces sp. SID13031]NEA34988.1 hypothetical protein [Streptomyces sp. SID13031]